MPQTRGLVSTAAGLTDSGGAWWIEAGSETVGVNEKVAELPEGASVHGIDAKGRWMVAILPETDDPKGTERAAAFRLSDMKRVNLLPPAGPKRLGVTITGAGEMFALRSVWSSDWGAVPLFSRFSPGRSAPTQEELPLYTTIPTTTFGIGERGYPIVIGWSGGETLELNDQVAKINSLSHTDDVTSLAFSQEGSSYVTGSSTGFRRRATTLSLEEVPLDNRGRRRADFNLSLSDDAAVVAVATEGGRVAVWSLASAWGPCLGPGTDFDGISMEKMGGRTLHRQPVLEYQPPTGCDELNAVEILERLRAASRICLTAEERTLLLFEEAAPAAAGVLTCRERLGLPDY